jgi:uncharacterized protein YciW
MLELFETEGNDMRMTALLLAVVCSTAAFAQDKSAAPAAKPAAQGKSKAAPAKPRPQSIAVRLQACLEIDDATKERLNCYDAVIAPAPKPKPPAVKGVMDCRAIKEEDERLTSFNCFVEKLPRLPAN